MTMPKKIICEQKTLTWNAFAIMEEKRRIVGFVISGNEQSTGWATNNTQISGGAEPETFCNGNWTPLLRKNAPHQDFEFHNLY